jgi:hypothetical protein
MYYGRKPRSPIRTNTCKAHGCYFPVWKEGYCRNHQYFVAAKKPIPKYKPKKPARGANFGVTSLPELFAYAAYHAKRPIICPVSGEDITRLFLQDFSVWKCCCAHVLSRQKYPLWRLNPYNIVLLLPRVHTLYDQGTELQRQTHPDWNWQYLYDLKDRLKAEYEVYAMTV